MSSRTSSPPCSSENTGQAESESPKIAQAYLLGSGRLSTRVGPAAPFRFPSGSALCSRGCPCPLCISRLLLSRLGVGPDRVVWISSQEQNSMPRVAFRPLVLIGILAL